MRLLKANRVVSFETLSSALAANEVTNRASTIGKLGIMASQRLMLDGFQYRFDADALAANISLLHDAIKSKRKERFLLVSDLRRFQPIVVAALTEEDKPSRGRPAMDSLAPEIFWGENDWPVQKIMPGVVAVIGEMFSGKTYHITHSLQTVALIRYGEPLEHIDLQEGVVHVSTFEEALTVAVVLGFCGISSAIDSLRPLVFGLKGNATEGGVSGDLYALITELNNFCVNLGTTVVVAVNPMSSNSEKTAGLYQKIGASCAGAVHLANKSIMGQTFRLVDGRTSDTGPSLPPVEDLPDELYSSSRIVLGSENALDRLPSDQSPHIGVPMNPEEVGFRANAIAEDSNSRTFPVVEII